MNLRQHQLEAADTFLELAVAGHCVEDSIARYDRCLALAFAEAE